MRVLISQSFGTTNVQITSNCITHDRLRLALLAYSGSGWSLVSGANGSVNSAIKKIAHIVIAA